MRALKGALVVLCAALAFAAVSPTARADEWNKKTFVHVYAPIELPGHVLIPGRYVFQLMNSSSDRHILEVWNKDQTHLVALVMANAAYRMDPTGRTVFHLEERMKDTPEALKEWFYPGDTYGLEFVYHYRWPRRGSAEAGYSG
jgi:hypothetical protein